MNLNAALNFQWLGRIVPISVRSIAAICLSKGSPSLATRLQMAVTLRRKRNYMG